MCDASSDARRSDVWLGYDNYGMPAVSRVARHISTSLMDPKEQRRCYTFCGWRAVAGTTVNKKNSAAI